MGPNWIPVVFTCPHYPGEMQAFWDQPDFSPTPFSPFSAGFLGYYLGPCTSQTLPIDHQRSAEAASCTFGLQGSRLGMSRRAVLGLGSKGLGLLVGCLEVVSFVLLCEQNLVCLGLPMWTILLPPIRIVNLPLPHQTLVRF